MSPASLRREGYAVRTGARRPPPGAVADGERVARLRLAAHERQRDRAVAAASRRPMPSRPTSRSPRRSGVPVAAGAAEPQPAQVAVRLAAEVQAGDGLLPDVAALLEGHGALVEPGLLRDHAVVEVDAVARPPASRRAGPRRRPRPPGRRRRRSARRRPRSVSAASHSTSTPRSVAISRTGAPAELGRRGGRARPRAGRPRRRRGARPGRSATAARTRACACAARRRGRA